MMRGFRMGRRGPHPANGKIYDITHADTDEHSVALPAGYPANTRAIYIKVIRQAGTGKLYVASHTLFAAGPTPYVLDSDVIWFRATDGNFYYSLGIANDDFDIYAIGYITA